MKVSKQPITPHDNIIAHTESKRKACDKCHQVKQTCSKEMPCTRCVKYSIVCTYDRPQKPMGRPRSAKSTIMIKTPPETDSIPRENDTVSPSVSHTSSEPTPNEDSKLVGDGNSPDIRSSSKQSKKTDSKSRKAYSHQGCTACKKVKKKCDEKWPVCSLCERNGLPCSGPTSKSSKTKARVNSFLNTNPEEVRNKIQKRGAPSRVEVNSETQPVESKFELDIDSLMRLEFPSPIGELRQFQDRNTPPIAGTTNAVESFPFLSANSGARWENREGVQLIAKELTPLFSASSHLNSKEKVFLNSLIGYSPSDFVLPHGQSHYHKNMSTYRTGKNMIATSSPAYSQKSTATSDSASSFAEDGKYEVERSRLLSLCDFAGLNSKEDLLLRYFVTEVSPVLFVDKTATNFLQTVVPLCLEDERIKSPVLAISAAHLSKAGAGSIEQYRDAVYFRARAQFVLVGEKSDESDNTLLSILLTTLLEVLEGTSLHWQVALEKMASIVQKRGGMKAVTISSPLVAQLFCYLDLISSLSTCSTPFFEQDGTATNLDNNGSNGKSHSSTRINVIGMDNPKRGVQPNHANAQALEYEQGYVEKLLNSKFGFKFGIGGEIFYILGSISTLASLRSTRYVSAAHEKKFNSLSNIIEMKLQQWSPPMTQFTSHFQINDSVTSSAKLQVSSFTLALQWAAFLRLHQLRFGYNRRDSRVEACLSIILQSIKVIEKGVELETGLMFPLIMAGSVAYEQKDMDYVLERVRSIKERIKFNYIGEFEKLLLEVWSHEDGDAVNWAKIRFYQFPGLVMF